MIFPDLQKINFSIGNNRDNDENDVMNTKLNFARLGYYNEPIENGIIDAGLDKAITSFQSDNGLKKDGWMGPDGETETTLFTQLQGMRKEALKQSRNPVDYNEKIKEFNFDENGDGEWDIFFKNPLRGMKIGIDASKIENKTVPSFYPKVKKAGDNEADAFRHGLWSYKLTKEYGPEYAKQVTDAYERSHGDASGSRLMDLDNNSVARTLAQDKNNLSMKDEDVIRNALKGNKFRTLPYKLKNDKLPFRVPELEIKNEDYY